MWSIGFYPNLLSAHNDWQFFGKISQQMNKNNATDKSCLKGKITKLHTTKLLGFVCFLVVVFCQNLRRLFPFVRSKTAEDWAPVHIVTKKEVVALRRIATHVKVSQEITVLAVDVTTDVDRCFQLHQHGLLKEYPPWQLAQLPDLWFWQLNLCHS